jgi:hypothetical protein
LEDLVGHPSKKKRKENHLPSIKFLALKTRLDSIFNRFLHLFHILISARLVKCFFQIYFFNLNLCSIDQEPLKLSILFGSRIVRPTSTTWGTEAGSENQHSKGNSFGTGSIAETFSRSLQNCKKRSFQLQLKKAKEIMRLEE